MASSKMLSLSLPQLLLALLAPILITATNSNHFAEYIGAEFKGVKFTDVPINSAVDFHFILAFAIDYTTSTSPPSPTNGKFKIFWDTTNLSPSAVSSIKQNNKNVKVALSIGGDTVSGYPVNFTLTSINSWVSNAVSSLTTIIQQYNLDGIDIDYEHFKSNPDTFAECIGQLVTNLKKNRVISFASIAPYDNETVQSHYQALWRKYGSVIDYVNFQFYAYSADTTVSQYVSHYDAQTSNYNGGKILASFATGETSGLPAETGFNACKSLKTEGKLQGIFLFSADDSKSGGFKYETQTQKLLANA